MPTIENRERNRRCWSRSLLLTLVLRALFLLLAYLAGRSLLNSSKPTLEMLGEVLVRWDAVHYMDLVRDGYVWEGIQKMKFVFYPLYPWTVWLVAWITPANWMAAILVSAIASVVAGYFLQRLLILDGASEEDAQYALLAYMLFPTAYFLSLPYTEPLFMALVLGSFCRAREGRWWEAGLFGMAAALTRNQGAFLLPALAVEAWRQRATLRSAFPVLFVGFGTLGFLSLQWFKTGHPFSFMVVHHDFYHHSIRPFWDQFLDAFKNLFGKPGERRMMVFESRLAVMLIVPTLLLASLRKLRLSYQVFSWLSIMLFFNITWPISVPRYVLSIFPLFWIWLDWVKTPFHRILYLLVSSALMFALFLIYCTGRWAF